MLVSPSRPTFERYITVLEAIINLEEEAHDPDGTLTGLYVALAEAKAWAQTARSAPETPKVAPSTTPLFDAVYAPSRVPESIGQIVSNLLVARDRGYTTRIIITRED